MSAESNDLNLKGCAPVPLAHYLKALGIFRIVAEQVEPCAKGYWIGDSFRLKTTMDRESLRTFFLEKYSPTPIVAPWNGGSGFYFQEEKLKEKDSLTGKKRRQGVGLSIMLQRKLFRKFLNLLLRDFQLIASLSRSPKTWLKRWGWKRPPPKRKKRSLSRQCETVFPIQQ